MVGVSRGYLGSILSTNAKPAVFYSGFRNGELLERYVTLGHVTLINVSIIISSYYNYASENAK